MTAENWIGIAVAAIGAVLMLNIAGVARGAAELGRWFKEDLRAGFSAATTPTTTWAVRLLGTAMVIFGVCVAVLANPS